MLNAKRRLGSDSVFLLNRVTGDFLGSNVKKIRGVFICCFQISTEAMVFLCGGCKVRIVRFTEKLTYRHLNQSFFFVSGTKVPDCRKKTEPCTFQATITYPTKREKKIIFKSALGWDMLIPRRVSVVFLLP